MNKPDSSIEWALVEIRNKPCVVGRLEERCIGGAGFLLITRVNCDGDPTDSCYYSISDVHSIKPLTRKSALLWSKRIKSYVPIDRIIQVVCSQFDVSRDDLVGWNRLGKATRARKIVFFLSFKLSGLSQSEIGRRFDRDHATIAHSSRSITDEMTVHEDTRNLVDRLVQQLQGEAVHPSI